LARELAAMGAETPTERHVKQIAPWMASLMLHLGVAMLALFMTWTVAKFPSKDDSVLIVADFNALNYEPVAQLSPTPAATSELAIADRALLLPPEPTIRERLAQADTSPTELLAGASRTGESELSRFAPKAAKDGATFAGVSSSNARKIVYVIDASGSMISSNYIVIEELARSLENLKPVQSFSVIFFQDNKALQMPPAGKLVPASSDERKRAIRWAKTIIPRGTSNPLQAIQRALATKPDAIFLLSTNITGYGHFEIDQRDLLERLNQLNPVNPDTGRRITQINCVQFLDQDPLETMQKIAKAHGGPNGYNFLSRKDLGLIGSQ
jgi:hypothetical protein